MSDKHTQGTIRYEYEPGYCGELIASNGNTIATFNEEPGKANARRLVACWNACEDEDTAMLEAIVREGTTIRRRHDDALRWKEKYQGMLCDVERQRDELLDALKAVLQVTAHLDACHATVEQAQAAIAKTETSK